MHARYNLITVSTAAFAATWLCCGTAVFAQAPAQPGASPSDPNSAEATQTNGGKTDPANPGYPIQGGGTYQGPPGKGAVINEDRGYNRT